MEYFPIFLDLKNRPALVVGGGELALRKLRLLQKAGAQVTVVAPRIAAEIAGSGAALKRRGFVDGDVGGQAIVFAATGLEAVDDRVATAARQAGLPVNVVDRPRESNFIMPAIVERDPIVVAISSGGAAPVLARRLREAIERLLPSRLGRLACFAESFRSAVAASGPTPRHAGASGKVSSKAPSPNRCWRGRRAGRARPCSLWSTPQASMRRGIERRDAGHRPARRHRPRQSRSADPARAPGHAARRCRHPRPAHRQPDPRSAAPRCRTRRGRRPGPGGDQRASGRARRGGQARRAAEGRRSLRLRARRRGARLPAPARHRDGGGAGDHGGAGLRRLRRSLAHPSRLCPGRDADRGRGRGWRG